MRNTAAIGARIVVGTDGSDHADVAVRWAADEAVRRETALEVVHTWLPPYPVRPTDLYTVDLRVPRAAEALAAATEERLRQQVPGLDVRASAQMAHPARALLRAAVGAELLVVGSRGHGGFASLVHGSVSERCLSHAPCSVAVVPAALAELPRGRVVVGVDGSAPSEEALAWAAREANLRWARLDVVHAWTPDDGDPDPEQASRALLEEMVDGLADGRDGGPPDLMLQSVSGPAVPALVRCAAQADLLVLGAPGPSGVRGPLLGSVSRQCAHHAPCPTVVVRGLATSDRAMASAAYGAHEP